MKKAFVLLVLALPMLFLFSCNDDDNNGFLFSDIKPGEMEVREYIPTNNWDKNKIADNRLTIVTSNSELMNYVEGSKQESGIDFDNYVMFLTKASSKTSNLTEPIYKIIYEEKKHYNIFVLIYEGGYDEPEDKIMALVVKRNGKPYTAELDMSVESISLTPIDVKISREGDVVPNNIYGYIIRSKYILDNEFVVEGDIDKYNIDFDKHDLFVVKVVSEDNILDIIDYDLLINSNGDGQLSMKIIKGKSPTASTKYLVLIGPKTKEDRTFSFFWTYVNAL